MGGFSLPNTASPMDDKWTVKNECWLHWKYFFIHRPAKAAKWCVAVIATEITAPLFCRSKLWSDLLLIYSSPMGIKIGRSWAARNFVYWPVTFTEKLMSGNSQPDILQYRFPNPLWYHKSVDSQVTWLYGMRLELPVCQLRTRSKYTEIQTIIPFSEWWTDGFDQINGFGWLTPNQKPEGDSWRLPQYHPTPPAMITK